MTACLVWTHKMNDDPVRSLLSRGDRGPSPTCTCTLHVGFAILTCWPVKHHHAFWHTISLSRFTRTWNTCKDNYKMQELSWSRSRSTTHQSTLTPTSSELQPWPWPRRHRHRRRSTCRPPRATSRACSSPSRRRPPPTGAARRSSPSRQQWTLLRDKAECSWRWGLEEEVGELPGGRRRRPVREKGAVEWWSSMRWRGTLLRRQALAQRSIDSQEIQDRQEQD